MSYGLIGNDYSEYVHLWRAGASHSACEMLYIGAAYRQGSGALMLLPLCPQCEGAVEWNIPNYIIAQEKRSES